MLNILNQRNKKYANENENEAEVNEDIDSSFNDVNEEEQSINNESAICEYAEADEVDKWLDYNENRADESVVVKVNKHNVGDLVHVAGNIVYMDKVKYVDGSFYIRGINDDETLNISRRPSGIIIGAVNEKSIII